MTHKAVFARTQVASRPVPLIVSLSIAHFAFSPKRLPQGLSLFL